MDTNSNIPVEKKVVSVEILHLDDLGYGPRGEHTRREWRKECLVNLLAGRSQFEFWQASWQEQINKELLSVNLAAKLIFEDDSQEDVLFTIYYLLFSTYAILIRLIL